MSSRSRPLGARTFPIAALALGALVACASDPEPPPPPGPTPDECATSSLNYQNFAAPFVINWCRGCHGAGLPVDMRQDAPAGVNFDTADEVRAASERILARATGDTATMPPAGGPSAEERELLREWLLCGLK
ncbi:MAG: hypothetical protein R3B48_17715 [Kofleriaceae bacterium]